MEGIKETKEVLKFAIEFGEAIELAMADKKFDLADVSLLMAPLMQAGSAFSGIGKVKAEMKDLSEEELKELIAYAQAEFDIANDKVEAIIEASLDLGLGIYKYAQMFKKEESAE